MQEMLYLIYISVLVRNNIFFIFDVKILEFQFFYQNTAILATKLNKVLPIKIEIVISSIVLL